MIGSRGEEYRVEEKDWEWSRKVGSGGERLGVEEKGWEWRRRIGSRREGLDYRRRDAYLDNKCFLYI